MSRHRVLIVGVGSIGERHVRCFQGTGRAEVSIVEPNPDLRLAVAERYRVSAAFDDLDAALANPPDLAVVATPAPSHVPLAITLANAGVHLLIEKPLSTNTEGIDALRASVSQHQIKAAVAYVYRAHPLLGAMREAIQSGRFGKPVEIVAVCGQHFPTYRPAYRTIYYNDHARGGGAIQDALTHVINAAEWLVGPVDRLVADADHQVLDGVSVEDTVHLLARHGKVMASYTLNQHQAPNEVTLTVVCEGGTARFEFHEHRWRWLTTPGDPWNIEAIEPLERDTLFIQQANTFLDVVEGKRPPACSLDEGLQTLKVNLAALASVTSRAWQPIESRGYDS